MSEPRTWEDQHGALIGARDTDAPSLTAALEATLGELGFTPAEPSDAPPGRPLSIQHFTAPDGAWIIAPFERGLALALAVKLARRQARPIDVVAARASYHEGRRPPCTFDSYEVRVAPSGTLSAHEPTTSLFETEYLDTDKPWRLVEMCIDEALASLAPGRTELPRSGWCRPPALPTPRLEALAWQIRGALTVEPASVGDRRALRIRGFDGATTISVVSDAELATLRPLLEPSAQR